MRNRADNHRLGASADRDFLLGQTVGRKAGGDSNFLRQDRFACEALCHVLQSCCDIDRVSECCEYHVIAVADIADDDFAAMDADAKADRLAQIMLKELIQFVDIGGNHRRGLKCLAAGGLRAAVESEQRQLPIADKLVGLTARSEEHTSE